MILAELSTETANEGTSDLDMMSAADLLTAMNQEDRTRSRRGRRGPAGDRRGRAAGSGCPPQGRPVDLPGRRDQRPVGGAGRGGVPADVRYGSGGGAGLIAGGERAFLQAVEGAEDDPDLAVADLQAVGLTADDVVVGLAASGRTPYTIGGLVYARTVAAATVSVACNAGAKISACADVAIEVDTGPEVLTGSTRLKAGTAQKLVCNMLSTASMIRTGKVFHNLMVDVRPTNAKLVDRARRIVSAATGVDPGNRGRGHRCGGRAREDGGGHVAHRYRRRHGHRPPEPRAWGRPYRACPGLTRTVPARAGHGRHRAPVTDTCCVAELPVPSPIVPAARHPPRCSKETLSCPKWSAAPCPHRRAPARGSRSGVRPADLVGGGVAVQPLRDGVPWPPTAPVDGTLWVRVQPPRFRCPDRFWHRDPGAHRCRHRPDGRGDLPGAGRRGRARGDGRAGGPVRSPGDRRKRLCGHLPGDRAAERTWSGARSRDTSDRAGRGRSSPGRADPARRR